MQAEVVYWTLGFCKTANSGLGHYREFRERRVIGVCGRGVRSVNCIHLLMIVKPRSRRARTTPQDNAVPSVDAR